MVMWWIARIATVVIFAACAPQQAPSDTVAAADIAGAPVTGVVRIVGSAPVNVQVVLQPDAGGSIRLTGPLRDELANLAGARVAVHGESTPSPDPLADHELRASGYDILSVDGEPVISGEIIDVNGDRARLRTASGEVFVLNVRASTFRVGQKVWVQGPQMLTVQSYGVIQP